MERRSLTDRQKAALFVLDQEDKAVHVSRVARLLDGAGKPGSGWSSTLRSMQDLGLVRPDYTMHGGEGWFAITDKGREALR